MRPVYVIARKDTKEYYQWRVTGNFWEHYEKYTPGSPLGLVLDNGDLAGVQILDNIEVQVSLGLFPDLPEEVIKNYNEWLYIVFLEV